MPGKFKAHLPERRQEQTGRKQFAFFFTALALVFLTLSGATAPPSRNTAGKGQPVTQPAVTQPTITHTTVTETKTVPFTATTQDDNTLAKGTTQVTVPGVDGVETLTYDVTYSNGKQIDKQLKTDVVTTPPVTQVTAVGTYVAPMPSCTNGTYVNSAGNTVCSPESASSAPAGATAQCIDGTYSFSQSRSGTCSHHGGASSWL